MAIVYKLARRVEIPDTEIDLYLGMGYTIAVEPKSKPTLKAKVETVSADNKNQTEG
jgi:hypothetical protein